MIIASYLLARIVAFGLMLSLVYALGLFFRMKLFKALNLLSFILMVVNLTYMVHVVFIAQTEPASLSRALVAVMLVGIAIMNLRVIQDEV